MTEFTQIQKDVKPLERGLVLRLEGPTGVTDQSTQGNDGTYEGGMGTVVDGGRAAFSFDGTDDFISLADNTIAPVALQGIGEALSISCLCKPTAVSGTYGSLWVINRTIIELRVAGATGVVVPFSFGIDSGKLAIGLSSNYTTDAERKFSAASLTVGTWQHVAVTISGNTVKFYIDGLLDSTHTLTVATGTRSVGTNSAYFRMGARAKNTGEYDHGFSGLVDSTWLHDRVLTAEEITHLASERGAEDLPPTYNVPLFRGPQASDYPEFVVSHAVEPVIISSASDSEVTVDDVIYDRHTTATYRDEGGITVAGASDASIENLDPSIATIADDGTITTLASGICRALIHGPVTKRLDIDLTIQSASNVDTFNRLVSGSVGANAIAAVDSRISGSSTLAANGYFFSSHDHTTTPGTYVRNPNVWCADIDRTCISEWNNSGLHTKAGTAVTPRHLLGAAHYQYGVGTIVEFVTMDNVTIQRTVAAVKRHPSYTAYYPDLTIYTLDSDLPASITPCKVMPSNHASYITQPYLSRIPGLLLDKEEKALIDDWAGGGSFRYPIDADRLIFSETKIGGDSGNPAFLIVNDELVLVTVWTYGGAGSGTPVADFISDLNSMIVAADALAGVSTGYTVTEADWSGFTSY